MIEEIRIRELGVIRDARLPLSPGFTVLTGETGAGKTMVVTGLGLLMGERADAAAVRTGADAAVVEGRLVVDPEGAAAARAVEAGGELDDGALLLVRTLASTGRSRAHVGGRGAPVGVLSDLAEHLVAVHGQTDQLRLRSAAQQLRVLDAFAGAGLARDLALYQEQYERWRRLSAEHDDVLAHGQERAREAELLRLGLEDVERVEPLPGEDVALREESERLLNVEQLRVAADDAHAALTGESADAADAGEGGADTRVEVARRALAAGGEHDPALAALAGRAAEIAYLLTDLSADVAEYAAGLEADPARLAAVEERRSVLSGLVRRYGSAEATAGRDGVDAVLAWSERAARRLLDLDDDGRLEALAAQRDAAEAELRALAGRLSTSRGSAAQELQTRVAVELAALAMPSARLGVVVSTGTDPGPAGCDTVELLLAAHSGAAPRPLARGASGGELSRVMLALEVVLAGADPVPTMVFDEVDAGVGGRAAVEIGRRLARLARSTQVLVVTHLPQVAAFADHHLTVVKTDDGSVTESGVVHLDDEGRVTELARMLSGSGTGTARAHAEELLRSSRDGDDATSVAAADTGSAGTPDDAAGGTSGAALDPAAEGRTSGAADADASSTALAAGRGRRAKGTAGAPKRVPAARAPRPGAARVRPSSS